MNSSVRLGSVGGIEIGIHYSWVLVFLLVAWTLAAGLFPEQFPGLETGTYWAMGVAASLLLFASVLVHELAHSFVAISRGLKVSGITLFVFGGVSNITGEPPTARDELLIAIVGPISSLLLGGLFWGIWFATGGGPTPVEGVLLYLAGINVLLAIFNLIPGFPLDGGRVLRAVVWWATNSLRTATRVATMAGHAVAFLFIVGGLFIAFSGAFLSGLWLMLIGWFLNNAAEATGRQVEAMEMLRGVAVRQVMNPRPVTVGPDISLFHLVHEYLFQRAVRAVPVVENGQLLGMVTVNEVRGVPRDRWEDTPVAAAMTRFENLHTIGPEEELAAAVRTLAQYDVNQLPVVQVRRLVGLLSRSNVMRFMQIRDELGVLSEEEEHPEEEPRRAA